MTFLSHRVATSNPIFLLTALDSPLIRRAGIRGMVGRAGISNYRGLARRVILVIVEGVVQAAIIITVCDTESSRWLRNFSFPPTA
jgi:hypothetical protein